MGAGSYESGVPMALDDPTRTATVRSRRVGRLSPQERAPDQQLPIGVRPLFHKGLRAAAIGGNRMIPPLCLARRKIGEVARFREKRIKPN